jgi:hypothetical protein
MRKLAIVMLAGIAAAGCGPGYTTVGVSSSPYGTSYAVGYSGRYGAVDLFYDDLSPYGTWVEGTQYGTVFVPHGDYVPYARGRWVYTDYGLTWVSDAPFGWATEHYGRWARVPRYGWAWIPGTEWSPAWVDFRYDDHYVAWAPRGPRGVHYHDYRYAPVHRVLDRRHHPGRVVVREHDRYRRMRPIDRPDERFFERRDVRVRRRDVPMRRIDVDRGRHERRY